MQMAVVVREQDRAPSSVTSDVAREASRLAALDRYDVLDTPREEAFDRLTRLAKKLFDVPVAAVSFIDAHRQWYKAREGLRNDQAERELSFCQHVVDENRALIVSDASIDPRFAQNPYVIEDPGVRFYAAVPLNTPDGHAIGSFCLIDVKPRTFSDHDLELLADLSQMAIAELELRQLSNDDLLTGSLTRRAFREEAARHVRMAQRHRDALSCIMWDLDCFKLVNDTHGHAGGDAVLAESARRVAGLLRDTDILGRMGGEEFAILLPRTDLAGATRTAEKLRAQIAAQPIRVGDKAVQVSASFGIATAEGNNSTIDTLLAAADKALYEAKAGGRNRCVAAAPAPSPRVPRQRVLKGGEIEFNAGRSVISCTVRSLGEDGAGLDVSSTTGIPKRFVLRIKSDNIARACHVEAQNERHLDVAFEQAEEREQPATAVSAHIRR